MTETLEAWEDSVNIGTRRRHPPRHTLPPVDEAGIALVTTVNLTCHFTAVSKRICSLFTTLEEIFCIYDLI